MTRRVKSNILLVIFAVVLFTALNNLDAVMVGAKKLIALCLPVVLGFVIAFILNVPMRAYENLLNKLNVRLKRQLHEKTKNTLSLLLAVLSIVLVLVAVFTVALPKITDSVKNLITTIDAKIPELLIFLEDQGVDTTFITDKLSQFDLNEVIKYATRGAFTIFETAVDATKSVVKYFSTTLFAIIIALYLLLDKHNLSRQSKKCIYRMLSKEKADGIYKTAYLIRDTFAKFLSGQCLEAVILAVLLFVLFTLFRLPYAILIALLASVLSFIPYIGSFVACGIGAVLTLLDSPEKALVCIIVFVAAQFIEQHFIYPHVVGNSVGLSPFYTIVAVLLGGNLFGVAGMIFFIPFFSVIFTLLRDYINSRP